MVHQKFTTCINPATAFRAGFAATRILPVNGAPGTLKSFIMPRRSGNSGTSPTSSRLLLARSMSDDKLSIERKQKTTGVAALGSLGVSVSPSGLLFPYYLGVFQALEELGCLENVILAGSSGGALIGTFVQSGLSMAEVEDRTKSLYGEVMAKVSRGSLLDSLREVLKESLPDDVHLQTSGRLAIAVTQYSPEFKGLVLDTFHSKDDLIDAVIASCSFVPVDVRGNPCADGLITNFFAPIPSSVDGKIDSVIKVCSVPAYLRPYNREVADISPDGKAGPGRFGPLEMLTIAFQPSTLEQLDRLAVHGYSDTMEWADSL